TITILRPALITHVPLFIAAFQPTFLWIAAVSIVLIRNGRRSASGTARDMTITAPTGISQE
ncbi:MAG: hypothetical protein ABIO06_10665, partial [Pseudolysinimonas sp.]